jgi:hypothetical protein
MVIRLLPLFALLILQAIASEAGELYITGYIEPNMAARADGGNPMLGIGLYQSVKIYDGLTASGRVEALLGGHDRDGGAHPYSIRYTVKLRYTIDPVFIEAERFAWNPITHVKQLPPGMKDLMGGGDTMSSYAIRTGVKW